MDNLVSMILAGGRGSRMGMLSYCRAKPLLPFAGRFRVIDFGLTNCLRSGVSDIAVLVDYQRSDVASYVVQWCSANGNSHGLRVFKPVTGSYSGTADAVYQNVDYLQRQNTDNVLILAADHVYKMNYRKMLAFHQKIGADATIGVVSVPIEQAHRFGIVEISSEGRVLNFTEKPRIPRSNLISMGIYIFNKQVLIENLIRDAADSTSPHDFGHAVIPKMVHYNKVFAYKFNEYWQDIGTVEAYYQANMELLKQLPSFSMNTRWSILAKEDTGLLPPRIYGQAKVNNSLISPGCVIKGKVHNSVLAPGIMVEEKAIVTNSVIFPNTSIGQHSVVDHCILDENVNIREYCYIGFSGNLSSGDRDITILGKGITVPPHTAIGRSCEILPDVTTSDFIKNVVPPNTILSHR
jgi:glucose-1-phosphate adenylyltransferase